MSYKFVTTLWALVRLDTCGAELLSSLFFSFFLRLLNNIPSNICKQGWGSGSGSPKINIISLSLLQLRTIFFPTKYLGGQGLFLISLLIWLSLPLSLNNVNSNIYKKDVSIKNHHITKNQKYILTSEKFWVKALLTSSSSNFLWA